MLKNANFRVQYDWYPSINIRNDYVARCKLFIRIIGKLGKMSDGEEGHLKKSPIEISRASGNKDDESCSVESLTRNKKS